MIRHRSAQDPGDKTFFLRVRLGGELDGLGAGLGADVRPECLKRFCQLRARHLLELAEAVDLQEAQQRFRRRRADEPARLKCRAEMSVARGKAAALLRRPDGIGLQAERGLQPAVAAGLFEFQPVQAGKGIEIQELVIHQHGRLLRLFRDEANYAAGDAGCIKAAQYADALVALFDIKLAEILIALNRIAEKYRK